jgi:hypothetical protein
VSRIRVEEVIERATDEKRFVHRAAMRATEAWREYLRSQGLPPYPKTNGNVEPSDIEIHFHVQ